MNTILDTKENKTQYRARFLARRKITKNIICNMEERTKKHNIEHEFGHEGKDQKV